MNDSIKPLVLVAEDDESNFKLIKAILSKRCELVWAHTGLEIIELYKQHRGEAKMILMDIKMPDMNAFTLRSAMTMVAGTARSMGISVTGTFPEDIK